MKFGKVLTSQMVQEWQEAYMDYRHLKKLLKDILKFRQQNALSPSGSRRGFLKRKLTMYRSFSGLTGRQVSIKRSGEEVILVNPVQQEGSENERYQTMFLRSSEEGGEYEIHFFEILDDEFNKVLKFYEEKIQEVKVQAEELSKQMDTLIALRIKVDKPLMEHNGNQEVQFELENGNSSPMATEISLVNGIHEEDASMDVIQEPGTSNEGTFEDEQRRAERDHQNDSFWPASVIQQGGAKTSRRQIATSLHRILPTAWTSEKLLVRNFSLWRRFRVNYPFIFGFKSGTELGFREIFLLASGLSVLTLAAVLSNLNCR